MSKPTKQEIKDRLDDFRHNIYDHGGSRIFIDGESGDRKLLVDTYYTKDFAEYIEQCVKEYFNVGWRRKNPHRGNPKDS